MKDNYKIIKEEFNPTTGETTVAINTDIGVFSSTIKLDEIDAKYPSIYHSHELALTKALRKFAKQTVLILKQKKKPLLAVLSQCDHADTYANDGLCVWGRATFLIKKEIAKLDKEIELWSKRIDALSKQLKDRIAARDMVIKKYIERTKKTNLISLFFISL